jgi:hypothetical protein
MLNGDFDYNSKRMLGIPYKKGKLWTGAVRKADVEGKKI